ncbi:MAG TPA: S9 family peptidase [Patescibacteria group bacterium]|nr:S9 family peptidase [Patescibacteria group bacterium]
MREVPAVLQWPIGLRGLIGALLVVCSFVVCPCAALAQSTPAQPAQAAATAQPAAAPSSDALTRLAPMDVFALQYAADPQISPDGKRIVYVRQLSDVMTDKRVSNLWLIDFDGKVDRALTTGSFSDASPRWSPDGTRIAYVSDRDGKPQIYVRWMDTGEVARITSLQNAPSAISWSPDGRLISFASFVETAPPAIASLPKPPEGAKWADPPLVYDRLIYRFNGRGYLKPGFRQLFVVAADGGAPRQLTTDNLPYGGFEFRDSRRSVWTPDGKSLIFSANLHPDWEYQPLDSEVYEIALADGALRALTSRKGPDEFPALSPDGKTIAYTGFDDRYQGHQTTHLYLMDRDGSHPRVVTPKLDRDVDNPEWAADGSGVYFQYDDQGDTRLGFYALDGSVRDLAAHLGSGGSSYSGGASFSVSRNRQFAVTYDTPSDPGDVAVGGGAGGRTGGAAGPQTRVITALNRQLFTQKKLGPVEEIWFESSQDHRRVQGWIVKPPDFDPAKKYPLILEIHGGPFANYGDRFDTNKQVWAARGYVVLYVNPRGSTSYGEEFANLIHHAYPGDDFFDLNSGVDAAIGKGYVDPHNLFVTGGSGGGVLTCWMIDRTTRFRAAASLYPVINWYSWVLTSDLPAFGSLYWFSGPPWEKADEYTKRSVLSYVDKVTTPTLLATGENDFRTPISEAEQYYAALKMRKVEAALVRFPEEPHGLQARPSHQIAKILYVVDWFEKHRGK